MFSVLAACVVTILVVGILARRRPSGAPGVEKLPGWVSVIAGALGLLAIAAPMVQSALAPDGVDTLGKDVPWLFQASLSLGLVGLATGIYALVRRDGAWRTWVGVVAGGLVTAFWLLFGLGEVLSST